MGRPETTGTPRSFKFTCPAAFFFFAHDVRFPPKLHPRTQESVALVVEEYVIVDVNSVCGEPSTNAIIHFTPPLLPLKGEG